MKLVEELAELVGTRAACAALAIPRATIYRQRARSHDRPVRRPRRSPRAIPEVERQAVLDTLNSAAFADVSVPQVHAQLLDQGQYLCSQRSMYRILHEQQCVRERRNQLQRPSYKKPELLACAPNQVWSWDITKLPGPRKWSNYHLYVVIDIFSRYVVGWMVAAKECSHLAQRFLGEACQRQGVLPGELVIHSDRGAAMTSKPLSQLYADLGIVRSLSRPHTSNDNPFSEAMFKTLKYRPEFPERFGCQEDARASCGALFDWYNDQHRHSGLAMLTPADVHFRRVDDRLAVRDRAMAAAFRRTPERFVRGAPVAARPPKEVWINRPPDPQEHAAAAAGAGAQ